MGMILGFTGGNCSGKGTVVEYLVSKGFQSFSLSDMIREELRNNGQDVNRENLIAMGNKLRQDYGPGVLGLKALDKIKSDEEFSKQNYAIDSIRNPAEVDALKELPNFKLITVSADPEVRYKRSLSRAREGAQNQSFDAFMAEERMELESDNPATQQLLKTYRLGDFFVENNYSEIDSLYTDIDSIVDEMYKKQNLIVRPTWDEYFMDMAYFVSSRSTCLRRKVGAVVVKDNRPLATGYNGAASGAPHCDELGGCEREKRGIPSGQQLDICRATHAEQNCIAQAARFDGGFEGATLYCNTYPCYTCAKLLTNSGISEVVFDGDYSDPLSKKHFEEVDVAIRHFERD